MFAYTQRSSCEGAWLSAATAVTDADLRRHRNCKGMKRNIQNGRGNSCASAHGLTRPAYKCRTGRNAEGVCLGVKGHDDHFKTFRLQI